MAYVTYCSHNLGYQVLAGNCLAMAQGIVGAPVMHNSATEAADATIHQHYDRQMPDATCVLWFSHYGSYGIPGQEVYKDWGHVVIYVPGHGFLSSSPNAGEVSGPYTYGSIEEIERTFYCSFRFWSEDLNGLRVCGPVDEPAPKPKPNPTQEDDMSKPLLAMKLDGGPMNGLGVMYEPDGTVIGLDPGQWDFWKDRVGCVPVRCENPGHWEYLSLMMAKRRARNNVTMTQAQVQDIATAVAAKLPKTSAADIAKSLQITVKK